MTDQSDGSPAAVNVSLEYLPTEAAAILADETQSPRQLLSGISAQIASIAPTAGICFSGDFVRSVQDRFDARGLSMEYGAVRGANVAIAKTMRTTSGGVDVVLNAELLFLPADLHPDEAHDQVMLLLHLAAHEAVHALHHVREEDSEATFNSMMISSPHKAYYATEAGTIIEEYRAELAAEGHHATPYPFALALEDDLISLRDSLAQARQLSVTDVPAAARAHLAAATNYWKALSLVSAQVRVAGTSLPESLDASETWQAFGIPIWARWRAALDQLPAGLASTDLGLLREVTFEMIAILEQFLMLTGVDHMWDANGREQMYWR